MKNIANVIELNPNTGGSASAAGRKPLSEAQKEAVAYFFMRLKVIYANQYFYVMADEKTEKLTKMEYARSICDCSKARMDEGFRALHEQRQNDPETWKFLDLDKVIGLVKTGGKHWQQRVLEAKEREIAERPKLIEQKPTPEQQAAHQQTLADLRKQLRSV